MDFNFIIIPTTAFICWFIGFIIKSLTTSPKIEKLIPVICGCCGIVINIIIFITTPELMSATDWPTVICMGIASGLAATGGHQIYKQLTKG